MPTESSSEPSLLERQRQLLSSSGYRATALQDRVKRISYIFQANVAQYNSLVAKLQDPDFSLPILDVRNRTAHDDLLSESERLLHNVLTAMSTRIAQQRAFMSRHFSGDPELTNEYRTKIHAMFAGDPLAAFLKELRNHIAHSQLPVAQSHQRFSRESFSITFILPCASLIEWDWTSGVRRWIANYGEAIPIVGIIDTYARRAAELDKWLFERIGLKYATEIQEFEQAKREFTREYGRVFGL